MVKSVDPMAPKPTPNISIVPPLVKARKQWYRWKHSGHWKERARMGPGILGPRSSQVGQSLLSEFARMVLTIVGPERLATIKMVEIFMSFQNTNGGIKIPMSNPGAFKIPMSVP